MIQAIAFTAYNVSDLKKAREFYEDVLGLKPISGESTHWQEYELGNGTFGIGMLPQDGPEFFRRKGASLALEVEDFDAAFQTLKNKSVPILMEPNEFPGCRMFVISDPDDNAITIHKLKK